MSELFEFLYKLFDLLCQLFQLSNDYTPARRKRVFSRGFVIFLILVAVFEVAILSAWARHQ
ncbi:hypothetical protein [Pseudomonas sp. LB1P83]